uniref:Tc1-like transposase DDE domain-containing protein n=1 Tax=Oncorhynchus tshawytscha TaxID=74940 RepID=A0AAZ3QY05_ONCTS
MFVKLGYFCLQVDFRCDVVLDSKPEPPEVDNDPKHTSRLCKGYLTKKKSNGVLHQMTWPPQPPDLNPIEMVWDELDRRVKEKQQTSAQKMWELLQD